MMQRWPRAQLCLNVAAVGAVSMRALFVEYLSGSALANQGMSPHWPTTVSREESARARTKTPGRLGKIFPTGRFSGGIAPNSS
jgi:hypothetical protein